MAGRSDRSGFTLVEMAQSKAQIRKVVTQPLERP